MIDRMVINLDTHIEDVCALMRYEDLTEVVLVGHSYGGVVVTGAADREPGRVRRIVYLDAVMPVSGEACLDLVADGTAVAFRRAIAEEGGGTRLPARLADPTVYGVTDPVDVSWVAERLADQPAATFEQRIQLTGGAAGTPRTYIRCTESQALSARMIDRVRSEPTIEYVELAAAHDAMLTAPEPLADLLLKVAGAHG
jgi:pimeloyl-ACP methyl ester carboxylesterase